MKCSNCKTDVSDEIPKVVRVTKYFSCPECGEIMGCRVPYNPDQITDEIPPGMLGIAILVGGGTTTIAGSTRGNTTIDGGEQQINASIRANGLNETKKMILRKKVKNKRKRLK
jgi:hypothetical protein